MLESVGLAVRRGRELPGAYGMGVGGIELVLSAGGHGGEDGGRR